MVDCTCIKRLVSALDVKSPQKRAFLQGEGLFKDRLKFHCSAIHIAEPAFTDEKVRVCDRVRLQARQKKLLGFA